MPSRAEARAVGPSAAVVVELRRVSKDYRSLRPLRVEQLTLRRGRSIALLGFDEAMAAVLTDLITGATVPDTGDVIVFGTPTAAISDGDAWLKLLDRLGLLSERSVLVDRFTAEQNLMLPITLDLEGAPEELRQRVRGLAAEVGLGTDELQRPSVLPARFRRSVASASGWRGPWRSNPRCCWLSTRTRRCRRTRRRCLRPICRASLPPGGSHRLSSRPTRRLPRPSPMRF